MTIDLAAINFKALADRMGPNGGSPDQGERQMIEKILLAVDEELGAIWTENETLRARIHVLSTTGRSAMTTRRDHDQQAEQPMNLTSSRTTARDGLRDLAVRKHAEAYGMEKLLDALPAKLPPEADDALWRLVERASR